MPKIRDVLTHVRVVTTRWQRRCSRNREHCIPVGGQCLVIGVGRTRTGRSYCPKCGLEILATATHRIREVKARLGPSPAQRPLTVEAFSNFREYSP